MSPLPERGRLEEAPLPRLLLDLHAARFSGALVLQRERVSKRVLLQEGSPVAAESNLASESLGVQLLDAGTLSREDYSRVVGYVQLKKCKEGKALLDLKLLGPKELFLALKDQLRRRILEVFGWPGGEFVLEPGAAPPEDAKSFRLDPIALVQQGLVAHWSADRTLASLVERAMLRAHRSRRWDSVVERLVLDPPTTRFLDSIDGSRRFSDCLQLAGSSGALSAAWVLQATGAVELRAGGDATGAAADDGAPEIEIELGDRGAARPLGAPPAATRAATPAASARAPAAGASRAGSGDEAAALRNEILERHVRLGELDHYALLGIAPNAELGAVKRAYFAAAKRYHPDALRRLGLDEVLREANDLFAAIARAHAVLSDPRERREYDAARAGGAEEADQAERAARAEALFRKGDVLLRKGAFDDALAYLAPAVELWPDEAAYRAALGWALYKRSSPEPEPAREHLRHAVRLDPRDGVTQYRLGVVLRALGEKEAADAAFARAKALEPAKKRA